MNDGLLAYGTNNLRFPHLLASSKWFTNNYVIAENLMNQIMCKVLVSNSSKHLERLETRTLALRFVTIYISLSYI